MNSNGKAMLFRGYVIPLEEIIEKVNSVTIDQVREFAVKYLKKESISISLVGNLEGVDLKGLTAKQ